MGKILQSIGVKEAEDKAVEPTTRMDFLGNTVDTQKMTIEVGDERKQELHELLLKWMHKIMYNKKALQSLIGKLSFVTNCVRPGRIFLSRLIEVTVGMTDNEKILVTEDMRKDVKWWLEFLPGFEGTGILWLQDNVNTDALLASDASLTGGGATHDKQMFHFRFSPQIMQETENIAQREMLTIMIAIKLWKQELSGKVVRFSTDNQNCKFAINKGHSKDKFILKCLREIVWDCAHHNILLKCVYIESKKNVIPDALSRWYQSADARRTVKRHTDRSWRRRSIDATLTNFHTDWSL